MKKWLNITLLSISILGCLVLLGFVNHHQGQQVCAAININIDRSGENYFIDEEDINSMVYHEMDTVLNRPISAINTERLERQINNHPSVAKSEVYKTIDGELMIDVVQRRPIVRVFSKSGDSYYIDEQGALMPTSSKYTARVLVASGHIYSTYARAYQINVSETEQPDSLKSFQLLYDVFQFADFIQNSPFWKAQIEQLYVNKDFEIELIPRVGNHRIVFGDAVGMQKKFEKLMIFYKKGLPKTGWNEYSTINLKFDNQIVCTKR